jgi:putative redox protein
MEMNIVFGKGMKVEAHFKDFVIETDQPDTAGGDNSAPQSMDLFLASIGTCAGYYVLSFCKQHSISPEGIRIVQHMEKTNGAPIVDRVALEIRLPETFPHKYRDAILQTADLSAVKRQIQKPPQLRVFTSTG